MKKLFILALAIGFISCSSDDGSNEENIVPTETAFYNLRIRSNHNLKWTAYTINNSPNAVSGCRGTTIRQGDTLRIWGQLNFYETDIELILRDNSNNETVIPLELSGTYLTGGLYKYKHCYNTNSTVSSSGGELFGTVDGITEIVIQ